MNDLHDQQLVLILEMIDGGTFRGDNIEVVTDLKIAVKVEIDARRREGLDPANVNDTPRAIESHK